ncbi:HNH endonuclease [Acinetobacter nosocomialis]|uniref:HNH endonuclease n=1 Tax=Acinetobacter nosocomialis TaxID=106654 RepID=UPI0025A27933|nr:HNH endonuclease [Acinetobacter nosocomialis]
MKYSYKSTYRVKTLNLELFIWNKERIESIIQILTKISTYKPLFNYFDYRNIQENKFLYEINNNELKKCIFCHKDSNQTSFKKFPHVIPYLLGNNYLLHYEECDECNEYFGRTIECELDKYITPHRTLNRLKNRSGNLICTDLGKNRQFKFDQSKDIYTGDFYEDEITFAENSNIVTFKLKQNKYVPMMVYKALMKISYGLLPREHLIKFEKLRKWIINPNANVKLFSPLNVVKTRLDGFSTSILDFIILHKNVSNLDEFKEFTKLKEDFEYLVFFRFGSIVLEFPLFTDLCFEKLNVLKEKNLPLEFNLPNIPKPGFPTNREILDFSETNKISTSESMYFQYDRAISKKLE